MLPFERRGQDRNREGRGQGPRGGVDPLLERVVMVTPPKPATRSKRALWLAVPIASLLVVLGIQASKLEPIAVLQIAFAALFAIGVGWIAFALASPRPERVICPACACPELANFDGGLRCRACGWNGRERAASGAPGESDDDAPGASGIGTDAFDVDELAQRLRRRGTLGDPPRRW